MVLIGLTGGIASGKSAAHQILENKGYPIIDADILARQAVAKGSPGLDQVIGLFGREFLNEEGELDRKKLGQEVFSDPEKLSQLEKIVHPLVRTQFAEIKKEWQAKGHPVGFYVVPLLFEKEMEDLFDQILLVHCTTAKQIERLMSRDGISEEQALAIIESQMPNHEKIDWAHHVIENNSDLGHMAAKLEDYLTLIPGPR